MTEKGTQTMAIVPAANAAISQAESPVLTRAFLGEDTNNAFVEMVQARAAHWMEKTYGEFLRDQRLKRHAEEIVAERESQIQAERERVLDEAEASYQELRSLNIEDLAATIEGLQSSETKKQIFRLFLERKAQLQEVIDALPKEHRKAEKILKKFFQRESYEDNLHGSTYHFNTLYSLLEATKFQGCVSEADTLELIARIFLNDGRSKHSKPVEVGVESRVKVRSVSEFPNENNRMPCFKNVPRGYEEGADVVIVVGDDEEKTLADLLIAASHNTYYYNSTNYRRAQTSLYDVSNNPEVVESVINMLFMKGQPETKEIHCESAEELIRGLLKIEMFKHVIAKRDVSLGRVHAAMEARKPYAGDDGLVAHQELSFIEMSGFKDLMPGAENADFKMLREELKKVHARRLKDGEPTIPELFDGSVEEDLKNMAAQFEEILRLEGMNWFSRLINPSKITLPMPEKQQELKAFFSGFNEDAERLYEAYLYTHYLYRVGMELYKRRPDEEMMWKGVERICLAMGTAEALLTQCRYYETRLSVESIVPASLLPDILSSVSALKELAQNPFSVQLDRTLGDMRDHVRAQIEVATLGQETT